MINKVTQRRAKRLLLCTLPLLGAVSVVRADPQLKAPTSLPPTKFTRIDFPKADGDTELYGINDKGQVIGTTQDNRRIQADAFLWSHDVYTPILIPGATEAVEHVFPTAINDKGQIVGSYYDDKRSREVGFLLSRGSYTVVASPKSSNGWQGATFLLGINNRGQCLGGYEGDRAFQHGFVWSRGAYVSVAPPEAKGRDAYFLGINDSGQVVGGYDDEVGKGHGFLFSQGVYTRIDYPGAGVSTTARFITDQGQVLGEVVPIASRSGVHAGGWGFLWWRNAFTRIAVPEAVRTVPAGVNDRGQVVGWYSDSHGLKHGFLFSRGVYTRVDFPNARNTELAGISSLGRIIGIYTDRGRSRGFLLTRSQSYDGHSREIVQAPESLEVDSP